MTRQHDETCGDLRSSLSAMETALRAKEEEAQVAQSTSTNTIHELQQSLREATDQVTTMKAHLETERTQWEGLNASLTASVAQRDTEMERLSQQLSL